MRAWEFYLFKNYTVIVLRNTKAKNGMLLSDMFCNTWSQILYFVWVVLSDKVNEPFFKKQLY